MCKLLDVKLRMSEHLLFEGTRISEVTPMVDAIVKLVENAITSERGGAGPSVASPPPLPSAAAIAAAAAGPLTNRKRKAAYLNEN